MNEEIYTNHKICPPEELEMRIGEFRDQGLMIASLNGSFDLLHAGHLQIIFEAKEQADVLVVALNTDASIQEYKAKDRPIIPLEFRLQMVAALEPVDMVTWFDETDPREILKKITPDVHVNGVEYGKECIEADTVDELGAELCLVERIPSLATSAIIDKIRLLPVE